jgi:hypothetical protein
MANLLTVQAQLQGDASSLVSALKDATKALGAFKKETEGLYDKLDGASGGGGGVARASAGASERDREPAVGLTAKLAKLAVAYPAPRAAVATAFAGRA